MHGNIEKYVNLFPVHPSYIENFEKIKLAQSQREILKTLSRQFDKIKDNDIPENEPGLITYDQYFEQMMQDASMMANPDFKLVSDTVHLVHDKLRIISRARAASKFRLLSALPTLVVSKLFKLC